MDVVEGIAAQAKVGAEEKGTAENKNTFQLGLLFHRAEQTLNRAQGGKRAEMKWPSQAKERSSVSWIADRAHNPFHTHSACYPWVCNASVYRERKCSSLGAYTDVCVCVCVCVCVSVYIYIYIYRERERERERERDSVTFGVLTVNSRASPTVGRGGPDNSLR